MPRGKATLNGHAANGHVRNPAAGPDSGDDSLASVPGLPSGQSRIEAAAGAFLELLARDDGWLRCVPAGEGKLSYFKWKFSSGQHKGKYVMYVAGPTGWTDGILGLAEKLAEVDDGVRKPAQDTFYDPR